MKKIILSAAVAAMAFSTSAMAADKGIDFDIGGQAVVYYQTADTDGQDGGLFDEDHSSANVGIQLDLGADLGNNFTFGSQLTYLGTAGLEKNLVRGVRQTADDTVTQGGDTTNELALTKIFLAKQIGNTTVKLGRQELPKSLSPLAYSEGWNVYKNTFDAVVAINTDIPQTTLVAAYVSGGTGMSLEDAGNLGAVTPLGSADVAGTAYMITASTKAVPMATVTASYYHLSKVAENLTMNGVSANLANSLTAPGAFATGDVLSTANSINADAMWLDVAIADESLPMGLNIGLQAGNIDPDDLKDLAGIAGADVDLDDTTAYGAKIGIKPMPALSLGVAYTSVNDGAVAIKNTGTGIKSPLYTQMVGNQDAISLDADTWQVKASYDTGMGVVGIAYCDVDAGWGNLNTQYSIDPVTFDVDAEQNDYNELDITYKVKAGGVQYFAAYVKQDFDVDDMDTDIVRLWARYNF